MNPIFKDKAFKWLDDVITVINRDDDQDLKALMTCSLMTEEEFDDLLLFKSDGEFLNDKGVFRCDGFYFQVCEDHELNQEKDAKPTDRFIVWGFAKDQDQSIVDPVYWTFGGPYINNKILDSVLN